MHQSFSLGRVAGMKIGANWTLIIVVWLIAWSLADTQLPETVPGHSHVAYWAVGVGAAVGFFVCLLAHELSHSVVARRHGIEVEGIVLWLFGGVSQLKADAATADVELRVAAAGPAMSIAIALGFFGVTRILDASASQPLLAAGLGWLGWMNGILAVFNLVPAFPLDGGRVLRAWLWQRSGDKSKATMSAANAGRMFAYALIGFGVLQFAGGNTLGGLWSVFLGWFLLAAATAEATQSIVETELSGVRVRDAMTSDPVVVPAGTTIEALIDTWLFSHRCSTFPVVGGSGGVVGLITLARVKQVPLGRRGSTYVSDVACPANEIVSCGPDDPLIAVIARMNASVDQRALVFDGGRLVGIVSPSDAARTIQHAQLSHRG